MFRALIARAVPRSRRARRRSSSGAAIAQNDAEYCWVFDPVDGTTNYAHGLPIFCCAARSRSTGSRSSAAIYDPNRRELFTAERGAGAWLNGAPLRVSSAETLIDALLCTGFPYTVQHDAG